MLLVESCCSPATGCMVAVPAGSVRVITSPLAPANQRGQVGEGSISMPEAMPEKPPASSGSGTYSCGGAPAASGCGAGRFSRGG